MKQQVRKTIAREFLWVIGMAVGTVVAWLLFTIAIRGLGYSDYGQVNELWDGFIIVMVVLWIMAFPLRYIYIMTRWSVKTMRDNAQNDIKHDGE